MVKQKHVNSVGLKNVLVLKFELKVKTQDTFLSLRSIRFLATSRNKDQVSNKGQPAAQIMPLRPTLRKKKDPGS